MRFFSQAKGRNDTVRTDAIDATGPPEYSKHGIDESLHSDSDTLSLEARDEKEVQLHPNQLTAQAATGVKKAEATALVWGKKAVYLTYAWIWVCFFMLALQSSIAFNVLYYAYAEFSTAPAIATASILASIIGGVIKLPIAKTLNLWGRAEGLAVFLVVYIVGIIICAACTGPNGYAAGYVIFYVGYSSLYLILEVFVADTSGLKNRAFAFAFVGTPFICTAFTGPLAAQSFILRSPTTGWRWAFGAFAIIMPVVFIPLIIVFKFYQKKAEKLGLYRRESSGRTKMQSIIHYIHEFDVIGGLILIAAFLLFLLPFSLESYGRAEYNSGTFIGMIVVGFCLFFVFAAWERFFARTHFVRWELFKQRTVIGACLLAAILFFSFYSWDQNYYNFVIVVYDLSISRAGYVTQVYNIGSTAWGVVFGLWIRYTKHFKYTCLLFGLPIMFLGAGLMIHFRGQDADLGYVIMCQVFIAVAGGTLVIGEDMAVMSAADRDGVPMMLSLISLFSSIGGAIGSAVAVSIYASTFPSALLSRLPADQAANYMKIYLGGYTLQQTYPVGSQTREAINYAWGQSQRYGAISATAVLALAIPCVAIWKNYRTDRQQNKGTMI